VLPEYNICKNIALLDKPLLLRVVFLQFFVAVQAYRVVATRRARGFVQRVLDFSGGFPA
jgi:hypothetical protein